MVGLEVVVCDEQDDVAIDAHRWRRLAHDVLTAELTAERTGELAAERTAELNLLFVDTDEMARLNAEHFDIDAPTDVLAFPIDADDLGDGDQLVLLGDVVVCPDIARANAPAHAGNLDDEIALLVVHGVLHVLGHDHATPSQTDAMRARERALLEQWHWRARAPAGFRHDHAEP